MRQLDSLARQHTEAAVQTIADIMLDPYADDKDRLKAADSILDRGHGKPLAATIQIPANRQQAAALAAMSDEELLTVIRRPLPRLSAPQSEPIDAEFTPSHSYDPLLI